MTARWSTLPGVAVLVGTLVTTTLLGAALLGAPSAASTAPAIADNGDIAFEQDRFETHRGDILEVPMSVPPGENVTLRFSRTTMAVTTRSVVVDGGDGAIVVVLNTYNGRWSVRNDTDRVVSQDTNPGRRVRPATYQLDVSTEDDWAHATIEVAPDSLDRINTWRASNQGTPFQNASDISTAIQTGDIARAESVRGNETLIVQLDAPGLSGALEAMPGENTTARFRHLFGTIGSIEVQQTNPAPELQPVHIPALNSSALRVFPDQTTETYYIAIDLSKTEVMRGDEPVEHYDFEDAEFAVSARLAADTNLSADEEQLDAYVAPRRARLVRSPDEPLQLTAQRTQHIDGLTTVGTGWNVSVIVRTTDDPSTSQNESAVRRTMATVTQTTDDNENRFDAVVNLSGLSESADASVSVTVGKNSLLDSPVPARVNSPTTTTTEPTPTTSTTTVTTSTTTTPTGATSNTTTGTTSPTTPTTQGTNQSPDQTSGTVPALGLPGTLLVLLAALGFLAYGGRY